MQNKALKITAFMLITSALLLVVNIGSYYILAKADSNYDFLTINNDLSNNDELISNVEEVIDPPLGNSTGLPNISTMFSLMVFVLPVEIVIAFSGEIIIGSSLKLDPKKKNLQRFGILMGSSTALSVVTGIIHYLLVYPAIHDIPIHKYTFVLPGTGTGNVTENPPVYMAQYGTAEAMLSYGVDILMLIIAMILILGIHFLAFKFIQGLNNTTSIISSLIPLIAYPLIWNSLIKQVTESDFMEKTGSMWILMIIFGACYVVGMLLILLWKLTLVGTAPKIETTAEMQKYEGKS